MFKALIVLAIVVAAVLIVNVIDSIKQGTYSPVFNTESTIKPDLDTYPYSDTVPQYTMGVVYDADHLIVDILNEGEKISHDEGTTIKYYWHSDEPYPETSTSKVPASISDNGFWIDYTTDVWLDITLEEAIVYLNSRSDAARMLDTSGIINYESLADVALNDIEKRLIRAAATDAVDEVRWEATSETVTLSNADIANEFIDGGYVRDGFDFSCRYTVLTAPNTDEVSAQYRDLLIRDGVNFNLTMFNWDYYWEDTELPCRKVDVPDSPTHGEYQVETTSSDEFLSLNNEPFSAPTVGQDK